MHLLIMNYEMDATSQVFSHQIEVVCALASKFDRIDVITGKDKATKLPKNVTVHCTDWQVGKIFRNIFRFYKVLFHCLRKNKKTTVFSHMTEVQSMLAAPVFRIFKINHYLWYAHKSNSPYLLLSMPFLTQIISSTPGSFPFRSKKVTFIGQGIRDEFVRIPAIEVPLKNFLHVGRFDPSKNIKQIIQMIEKMKTLNSDLTLTLIGSPSNSLARNYMRELTMEYEHSLFHEKWLSFIPAVKNSELPSLISNYDVFVHAFDGSLDKSLIEATLVGIPTVTTNLEYISIFGRWGATKEPISLESEINALLELKQSQIREKVHIRQNLAIANHSFEQWIDRLVHILNQ